MKKPSSTTNLFTINGLSDETGVDRRTIKKRLANTEPRRVDNGQKYYALEDLEAATAQAKEDSPLRDQKLREEVRKLKIANDAKESVLVKRADVAAAIRRALALVATISESKLVNEFPIAVSGLDVPQARIYGRRLHDSLMAECQKLAREFPE